MDKGGDMKRLSDVLKMVAGYPLMVTWYAVVFLVDAPLSWINVYPRHRILCALTDLVTR